MIARCACGNVELETTGAPILSVVCYCDDCQEGFGRIEALLGACAALNPDGGAPFVLMRKDRVKITKGEGRLHGHKLQEKAATKRVAATCCNSPMFLDFEPGHWLSLCSGRIEGEAPPAQMRIQTKHARAPLTGAPPVYPGYPLRFFGKLLGARAAMMLGR